MNSSRSACHFAVVLTLLILTALAVPSYAQPPTPTPATPRDALINQIKAYAATDANEDSARRTQFVVELFKGNTVGLTPQEIAQIYEAEYTAQKEAHKPSPWEQLRPNIGWLVAGILALLFILRDLLIGWITHLVKAIADHLYNRLAGSKLFRGIALRRYRKALTDKYEQLFIPFRPNRPLPLTQIYVPLKVAGTADVDQIDARAAIVKQRRLVVRGAPGSGKSMLLKRVALSYAQGYLAELPDQPIVVLLDLHRLNTPELSLEQHIAEEFARNDFPNAETFVAYHLNQGTLMLLLDGLDEVNSVRRGAVVQQIKRLLDQHRECRVIITCRTAVYRGEFDDTADQTLDIVEFNDQQIRFFLTSWAKDMHKRGKSVEQLMRTLRDRPLIMALARNPLLLTIIAYLYTDTAFVLPSSRSEFYRKSTDLLLDLWHDEKKLNQYKASDKRLVLQHLALFNQDSAKIQQQDHRSIDYPTVLEQIRNVLPSLNLRPDQDARPLLDEIVERSGLLLSIDGGERFQFAHLTLQEFFTAAELLDDADGLITRFKANRDLWRETVKLWCGLASDSTKLIEAVFVEDAITAFECLADAQKVEQEVTRTILRSFVAQLGKPDKDGAIDRAFGAVAADTRPRGAAVFKFLANTLTNDQDAGRRQAAANALALTNLPEAAATLAALYRQRFEVRAPLVRMGDLAVPALSKLADHSVLAALDDLQAIGTPLAAEALVPLLWHSGKEIRETAAWHIAALLQLPNVEEALQRYPISVEQRRAEWLDWVWKPFDESTLNSALAVIAGRVAYLLNNATTALRIDRSSTLDPRLVVPVLVERITIDTNVAAWGNRLPTIRPSKMTQNLMRIEAEENQEMTTEEQKVLIAEKLRVVRPQALWAELFAKLALGMQLSFVLNISERRIPTQADWLNIFRPLKYDFEKSWHYRLVLFICLIISSIASIQILRIIYISTTFVSVQNFLLLFAFVIVILAWIVIFLNPRKSDDLLIFLDWRDSITMPNDIPSALIMFFVISSSLTVYCFATLAFLGFFSWRFAIFFWMLLPAICTLIWKTGKRREHEAANPLHGILNSHLQVSSPSKRRLRLFRWLLRR